MENMTECDFETLDKCPWGGDKPPMEFLYKDFMGCEIVRCQECGLVFAKQRLNKTGLAKYWEDYLSRVHLHDSKAVEQRNKMYEIDFQLISEHVTKGKVLDVGCGNGSFLKLFEINGYDASGVEFGKEAADTAASEHTIYYGEFPKLVFKDKYDLIIFRGVLQYVPEPKAYLEKAIELLASNGHIFITAQPNVDSLCFNLFKENFTQPVTGVDFLGYTEGLFTEYFTSNGLKKVAEKYFYEETPYANIEEDILKVAKAIECKRENKEVGFKAPAFYGNMMSLVYCLED
ncbi:MAG TPA: class I SAM-dependent methyltransferase [Phascolarctobacterium faecium]|uniref:class I SAM-dependent methyltransferase n=1 Tax=Phascolarctobacterium faecium TaxID=33025 RepID=UPI00242F6A3A|nr:class I SAM-dependent methyltransferase [Phascolarctobacterium faecium]HJI09349.1 class I SAM-dependent methyltransferase [Phascolarctobacterium faecium]